MDVSIHARRQIGRLLDVIVGMLVVIVGMLVVIIRMLVVTVIGMLVVTVGMLRVAAFRTAAASRMVHVNATLCTLANNGVILDTFKTVAACQIVPVDAWYRSVAALQRIGSFVWGEDIK